jgi:hypothetical protein
LIRFATGLIAAALMGGFLLPGTATAAFDRHALYSVGSEAVITERAVRKVRTAKQIRHKHQQRTKAPANQASRQTAQIVAHPAGCPVRAFCGCGTSLYLLGKAVREGGLAIAAKWLDFPRAACAPRMAAARRGHVFAIIECLGGNRALVYDPNSGGHKTRIHVRDLRRYAIVNPHGRYADGG